MKTTFRDRLLENISLALYFGGNKIANIKKVCEIMMEESDEYSEIGVRFAQKDGKIDVQITLLPKNIIVRVGKLKDYE